MPSLNRVVSGVAHCCAPPGLVIAAASAILNLLHGLGLQAHRPGQALRRSPWSGYRPRGSCLI